MAGGTILNQAQWLEWSFFLSLIICPYFIHYIIMFVEIIWTLLLEGSILLALSLFALALNFFTDRPPFFCGKKRGLRFLMLQYLAASSEFQLSFQ